VWCSGGTIKVLIIGSAGQDGQILTNFYKNLGIDVYCISRNRQFQDSRFLHWFSQDLIKELNFYDILEQIRPDLILHLAGIHGPAGTLDDLPKIVREEMQRVHVKLTQVLIDWCEINPRTRMVVSLSSKMYSSSTKSQIINSDSELNPTNYYGETKAQAFEKIKKAQQAGLLIHGAILFTHTSPFSKDGFLLFQVAKELLLVKDGAKKHVDVYNSEEFIDISDARDICLAIDEISRLRSPINSVIGNGKVIKIKDIVQSVFSDLIIEEVPVRSRNYNPILNVQSDQAEMKEKIPNWLGSRNINSTLLDIVEYLRNGTRSF